MGENGMLSRSYELGWGMDYEGNSTKATLPHYLILARPRHYVLPRRMTLGVAF